MAKRWVPLPPSPLIRTDLAACSAAVDCLRISSADRPAAPGAVLPLAVTELDGPRLPLPAVVSLPQAPTSRTAAGTTTNRLLARTMPTSLVRTGRTVKHESPAGGRPTSAGVLDEVVVRGAVADPVRLGQQLAQQPPQRVQVGRRQPARHVLLDAAQ